MKSEAKSHVPVLVLGGGLAGVSTAYHLPPNKALVIEREKEVGGTARSFSIGGFTFDFTGHLLHLHTPYTKQLITKLLQGNFFSCVRNTWIFSKDSYTRYPFQANTYGLPESTVDDCVLGFVESHVNGSKKSKIDYSKLSLRDWSQSTFGDGITKHFMEPYNEKLFQTSVNKISSDWCGPFVPKPRLDDVIRGALLPQNKRFGYNTTFLYPKKGGIQVLAQALAEKISSIRLKTAVKRVDWRKSVATLSNGEKISYDSLVSTIPLPELLKAMDNLPAPMRRAKNQLRYASIWCINIGVNRAKVSDASWIYFPEKEYPFYRVGFPMNFTPHVVPKGCSSMYVEVPGVAAERMSRAALMKEIRKGLVRAKILKTSDKFVVTQILPIKYAYVVFNRQRAESLSKIFAFLKRNRIQSIGRYGAWKYSFMEEAILDGKKAAENVRSFRQ